MKNKFENACSPNLQRKLSIYNHLTFRSSDPYLPEAFEAPDQFSIWHKGQGLKNLKSVQSSREDSQRKTTVSHQFTHLDGKSAATGWLVRQHPNATEWLCLVTGKWEYYWPESKAGHKSQKNRKLYSSGSMSHKTMCFKITASCLVKLPFDHLDMNLPYLHLYMDETASSTWSSLLLSQEEPFSLIWQLSCPCECFLSFLMRNGQS